ncbi:MAG: adenosine deaminase [Candidatus Limnocylindrales bacterium]
MADAVAWRLGRRIEDDPLAEGLAAVELDLLRRMPKAESHLHLDGSLRPATAFELARQRGLDQGLDLAGMTNRLVGPERMADQADLLRCFELPIAILQDAESLSRVAAELVEDVAAEGIRYVEIRWGPGLHVQRGLSLRDGIAAVVAGCRTGAATVALQRGIEIVVRLIAVALRNHEPAFNVTVAQEAIRAQPDGLTGFDLAGPEAAYPDALLHAAAFDVVRAGGLGITVHAGEWGGAAQVRRALALRPSRIAHGAPAADDAELMAELRARDVTLDLCPTSNIQTASQPSYADHPLPRIVRAGVPATLSTDDRTVSALTLTGEYARARASLGLSLAELWRLDRHALEAAFLHHDESQRADLLATFDAFAAMEPRLAGDQAG